MPLLTPSLAAYMLGEAYEHDIALYSGMPESQRLEALARALDADPDLLEAAWTLWTWEMHNWSEVAVMEARYWIDAVLIGDLPIPE